MRIKDKSFPHQSTSIGNRVKTILKELDINQTAFANELGFKHGSIINNILQEKHMPSFETLVKIVAKYDVNPGYLLMGKGEIFSKSEKLAKANEGKYDKATDDKKTVAGVIKFMNETITAMREQHQRDKEELYKTNRVYTSLLVKHKIIAGD